MTPVEDAAYLTVTGAFGVNETYDVSIRYDGAAQGWLSIDQIHGTTPVTLNITADPTNLQPGTYSAQILAAVGPLRSAAWTSVSFIVAPAFSNPGGVAASPSGLAFLAQSLSAQTISVYSAPGSTAATSFSVFANPSNWLMVTTTGQTTPGAISVLPLPGGLSPGLHTGTVTISTPAGKSTVVPVTLSVPADLSGSSIALTPGQRALTFNYQLNTTVNPQQNVYVSTSSTQYTNFTASASASWIGVAATAYATPALTALCFAPGLLYVSVDPTGLTAGTYKGSVTLTASGATPATIPITLTVSGSPVLNSSPSFIWLDTSANVLTSNLSVTGSSSMYFTATTTIPWLSIAPSNGIASASAANVLVTADVTGLSPGTYSGNVVLTALGGSLVQNIPVELYVVGTAPVATVVATPNPVKFTGVSGVDSLPQFVFLSAGADNVNVPVVVAAASDSGWLTVDPPSGTTPFLLRLGVNSAASAGLHTGSIIATSLATGDQATVTVTYNVTARLLAAAPAALTFVQPSLGAPIPSAEVQVTANAPSTFVVSSQPGWAKIVSSTAPATPAKLTVSVDPTGLAPGTYQDTIVLTGPSTVSISVALTVAAPAPPTATPKSLAFQYRIGSPKPAAQTIQIASPSGAVSYTAVASTVSGVNWLAVDPVSGTTPATLTVGIAVSQLVPGPQSGSITITLQNAAASTFTVPVTLTVTGSVVQVNEVLNAAAMAPGSISPGEAITLTGFGLGPVAGVLARPSAAGAYPSTMAGTTVTFDGTAAPLLYVQDGQVNALVPYSVYGRTNTQIQVQSSSGYSIPIDAKVVDAAPAIFTTGGTGRGQAAALNADSTPNSLLNPAARGSVIVLYLTGEGQTDPAGQDGRVIAADLRTPLLSATAQIGGQPADVLYVGSAPMLVSGICQMNVRIPDTVNPGTQPVEIRIGGIPSQRGITIEVR